MGQKTTKRVVWLRPKGGSGGEGIADRGEARNKENNGLWLWAIILIVQTTDAGVGPTAVQLLLAYYHVCPFVTLSFGFCLVKFYYKSLYYSFFLKKF